MKDKKKNPINWIEIAAQFLTGLITGIIDSDNRQAMEIAGWGESPSLNID